MSVSLGLEGDGVGCHISDEQQFWIFTGLKLLWLALSTFAKFREFCSVPSRPEHCRPVISAAIWPLDLPLTSLHLLPFSRFESQGDQLMPKVRNWVSNLIFANLLFAPFAISGADAAYTFTPLGDLPGGGYSSTAVDVSGDGSVVTGFGLGPFGMQAFRWTAVDGMIDIGNLPRPNEFTNSPAIGISKDGSTIVGFSYSIPGTQAFRWTETEGMIGLGDLPGGSFRSEAWAVSGTGNVIVGNSISNGIAGSATQAFIWTAATGMVGLGDLMVGVISSRANGITPDGNVVVGQGTSFAGSEAFRWTSDTGMVGIGDLPGGFFSSRAQDISADGSVIVGDSVSEFGTEAFRWTAQDGMIGLGDLPGGAFRSEATGISGDGSIIVGAGKTTDKNDDYDAFIWTAPTGMLHLQNYLIERGVLGLDGWRLRSAIAISKDGGTIVGAGINPDGKTEAFVVTIPETSTLLLTSIGAIALGVFAFRKRRIA